MATFTTTQPGASSDYIKYIYGQLTKTDRVNEPDLLDFALFPSDNSFVKLNRGAYVTLWSSSYGMWFSGYITNEPELEYIGTAKGSGVWAYRYQATSDDYILNLKPLGLFPPFINTTQGAILKTLANALSTSVTPSRNLFAVDSSDDFSNSVWSKVSCAVTTNAGLSPDGTNTADVIVGGATSGVTCSQTVSGVGAVGGNSYSIYIKKGSGATKANAYMLRNATTLTNLVGVTVNFDTGVISYTVGSSGATIEKVTDDGWWRLTLTATTGISNGDNLTCYAAWVGGSGFTISDFSYVWGAQLEKATSATAYETTRSSFLDTSNIGTGLSITRYVVDPNKHFSEIVKEFAEASNYRFQIKNRTVTYAAQDATAAAIAVDGNSKHFTPSKLSVKQIDEPVINDVIVTGGIEPQNYFTEEWVGDGFSAQYPLLSSVFGVDRSVLLDDDFSASTIDTTKWSVYDTFQNRIVPSNGYLNALGGTATATNTAYPYDTHIDSASLIPLEGNLRITHGEWDFVNTGVSCVQGVIGGLWTGAPTRVSDTSYTGCVFGIRVNRSSGVTTLNPIANTAYDSSQSITVDYTKRYIIRSLITSQALFRAFNGYSFIDQNGVIGTATASGTPDSPVVQTIITEINASTGAVTNQWTWANTLSLTASQSFALYIPLANNDLHCTVANITVSTPMQASLEIFKSGGSGFVKQFIGPNEIDSLDGMAPVATIVDANSGTQTRSSLLGTAQYNPGQASLGFFKDTTRQIANTPQVGDIIRLRYRRPGAAIARVQDVTSVATEATAWGDNGVRSMTKSDLTPVPRNTAECELAAAALLSDTGYQHYEGTYTMPSGSWFSGEPLAGTVLKFQNLPASFPSSLKAESISTVKTTFEHTVGGEHFTHEIAFGRSTQIGKVLSGFARTDDVFAPQDTAEIPNYIAPSTVFTNGAYISDVPNPFMSSKNSTNYTIDAGQAAPLVPNMLLRTSTLSHAAWNTTQQLGTVTDNTTDTVDPLNTNTATKLVSTTPFTDPYIGQQLTLSQPLKGQTITGSVWVKGTAQTAGKNSAIYLFDSGGGEVHNHSIVLTTSWQRHVYTVTFTNTVSTNLWFRIDFVESGGATGDIVYVWGPQCELGNATEYVANVATRTARGGFEVRYTDDSWGCDDAKNLVGRFQTETFTVPRSARSKSLFIKQYDERNLCTSSEDLTATWTLTTGVTASNAVGLNPDNDYSQISTIAFPTDTGTGTKPVYYQCSPVLVHGMKASAAFWIKGTAGKTVRVLFANGFGDAALFNSSITLNGSWQKFNVGGTFVAGPLNPAVNNKLLLYFYNSSTAAQNVQITRVNIEVGTTTETVYCKTSGTGSRYGAMSRFASALALHYPLTPTAPTASIDTTNRLKPVVNVTLPAVLTDVWGVEIRTDTNPGNPTNRLYKADLSDSTFSPAYIFDNSALSRSLTFYVYTYNLLGEYSSVATATTTIPTPSISSLTVNDFTEQITWSGTNATSFLVEVDKTDTTFANLSVNDTTANQFYRMGFADFYTVRYIRVTPKDALGSGTAATYTHSGGSLWPSRAFGKNMLANSGFELNTANVNIGTSAGQIVSSVGSLIIDGWYVHTNSNGLFGFMIDNTQTAGLYVSGANSIRIKLMENGSIPSDNTYRYGIVCSPIMSVRAGDKFAIGGFIRWDLNTAFPTGVSGTSSLGLRLYDKDGNLLTEVTPSSMPTTATGGAFPKFTTQYTVPATIGGVAPARMQFQLQAAVKNNSGSTWNMGNFIYQQLTFDDVYLTSMIVDGDATFNTSTGLNGQGSVNPQAISATASINSGYDATSPYVTVTVTGGNIYLPDGTVLTASGISTTTYRTWPSDSSAVTASTTYNINVVYRVSDGATVVQFFKLAPTSATRSAALADGYIPITLGPYTTTPATVGGGSSGGSGSSGCFSGNTQCKTKDGDKQFVNCPTFAWVLTQRGWRLAKKRVHNYDGWMIDMGDGELVTFGHPILVNGVWMRAEHAFIDKRRVPFKGDVFTWEVLTTEDEERNFVLSNGSIAHNMSIN
jgi:hypothetical protein